jgi:methylmalonyl-CoA mutase C-terminal domain/subunit
MARIMVTKLGLDGHDVGAKVIAAAARDAGHDVIYLGIRQSPEATAAAAIEEDVDVIAVSLLSGAHLTLGPALVSALVAKGSEIPVVIGGLIPSEDEEALRAAGVAAIVPAGTTTTAALRVIESQVVAAF